MFYFKKNAITFDLFAVTIHPAPQLHETPVFDFNPRLGLVPPGEDMDDGPENDLLSANKKYEQCCLFNFQFLYDKICDLKSSFNQRYE